MTDVKTYLRWLSRQVGTREKPPGTNRQPYAAMAGHANGYAWCASFQVAGARQTGLVLPPGAGTASCAINEAAYKRAGRLGTKPRVGAVFFVYFPSLQRAAHTGVVWKISDGGRTIHTIEGNSNDDGSREGYEVCLRTRPAHRAVGAVGVRSYGMPLYEEEIMNQSQLNELKAALIDGVADEVMRRLKETPAVENIPLAKGDPKAGDWSFAGVLAADDRKLDLLRRDVRAIHNAVVKPT